MTVRDSLFVILSMFLVLPSTTIATNITTSISLNICAAVEHYMREKYIRGWHNSNHHPPTHARFMRDFETHPLFKGFKMVLQSGDPEAKRAAKRVCETVLRDLSKCLALEKEYELRLQKWLGIFVGSFAMLCLLTAPFAKGYKAKAELLTGLIIIGGFAYFAHYRSELKKNPEALEKAKKEAWWGRLLEDDGRYERVIDALEKRIEVWSQLLPGDTAGPTVTIEENR